MPYGEKELNQVRRILYKWGQEMLLIEERQRDIAGYQALIATAYDTLKSTKLTGMPRGHNELTSVEAAAENASRSIARYNDAIARLTDKIAESIKFREAMSDCIATLDADERQIVRLRYENDHQWRYIESKMKMSRACLAWKEAQLLTKLKPRIEVKSMESEEMTMYVQKNLTNELSDEKKSQTNPDKPRQN